MIDRHNEQGVGIRKTEGPISSKVIAATKRIARRGPALAGQFSCTTPVVASRALTKLSSRVSDSHLKRNQRNRKKMAA